MELEDREYGMLTEFLGGEQRGVRQDTNSLIKNAQQKLMMHRLRSEQQNLGGMSPKKQALVMRGTGQDIELDGLRQMIKEFSHLYDGRSENLSPQQLLIDW